MGMACFVSDGFCQSLPNDKKDNNSEMMRDEDPWVNEKPVQEDQKYKRE